MGHKRVLLPFMDVTRVLAKKKHVTGLIERWAVVHCPQHNPEPKYPNPDDTNPLGSYDDYPLAKQMFPFISVSSALNVTSTDSPSDVPILRW